MYGGGDTIIHNKTLSVKPKKIRTLTIEKLVFTYIKRHGVNTSQHKRVDTPFTTYLIDVFTETHKQTNCFEREIHIKNYNHVVHNRNGLDRPRVSFYGSQCIIP